MIGGRLGVFVGELWRQPTRRVAVVAAFAVCCVALGALSWSDRGYAPTPEPEHAATHGLTIDQAACQRLELTLRRTAATVPEEALQGATTRADGVMPRIGVEVTELDAIADAFPTADYRVIDGIARVADASALVAARVGYITLQDAEVVRAEMVDEARLACASVAGEPRGDA